MKTNDERIVIETQRPDRQPDFSTRLNRIVAKEEAKAFRERRKQAFIKRSVNSVFWWHMFDMLILGGPFVALIFFIGPGSVPNEQVFYWTFVAIAIWVIAFVRQHRRFSRFRCRECGRMLIDPREEEGNQILFRCHDCKIDWDIGFIHSTD